MKRLTAAAVGLLALAACQDSTMPVTDGLDIGQPNISISSPSDYYGFVDGFFSFLKPLVGDPVVSGNTLNTNLIPTIELWQKDQLDIEASGTDHACVAKAGGIGPKATFTPHPNTDLTYYEYGWKTSDDNLTTGVEYRLCVKVKLATGPQLVGWRDIRPDKTNDPNSPPGTPYLFQNGSNIPIKFWLSSKSLCMDDNGQVIDCTVATFDPNGGAAYCDNPQCGMDFPQGLLTGSQLITFELRYIKCPAYNIVNGDTLSVEYLDIDIPQYYGCLNVTAYANFNWAGFQGGNTSGIVFAACRDTDLPNIDNDRVLLHIESHQVASDGRKVVYSLPTRPFTLDCDQTSLVQAPGADGSIGDWARYYAARGAQAFTRTLLPFVDPPELVASHAGFGGGSSSGCDAAVSSADGSTRAPTCSTPSLAAGATTAGLVMSPVYEYRAVWALPSMISERLRVNASGIPVGAWVDPVSATGGGALYPAVRVVNAVECVGTTQGDCTSSRLNVAGATVTFRDLSGSIIGTDESDVNGIAFVPWTLPSTPGLYTATASGLGIGVDPPLASVTLSPPPAVGTYQDHIGNYAIPLQAPKVKFDASVCSDYRSVLSTPGVDPVYATKGHKESIPINVSGAGSTAYLYTLTDCYNTYFALEVPAAQDFQNALRIVFVDEETHGTLPTTQFTAVPIAGTLPARSDDMWMIRRATKKDAPVAVGTWLLEDWHVSNDCTGSSKQSECGAYDVPINGEPGQNLIPGSDGLAVHEVSNGTGSATVFEFARRFNAPVDPQDFPVPAVGQSVKVGFYLVLQMGNGAQGNTEWPGFRLFQPITITRQ